MNKPDEIGQINGLTYVINHSEMGHRCGYVGIHKSHPLHGLNYSDPSPLLVLADDEEIGERGIIPIICRKKDNVGESPDCFFNVHGGITYSGGGEYPLGEENDLWWFGFDCAHCDDAPDPELMSPEYQKIRTSWFEGDGHIWTRDEVREQCVKLAAQLAVVKGN